MSDGPIVGFFQPAEGEVLKLGPPAAGEVIIKVDPRRTGSTFTVGTETLLPNAQIPVHRHLHHDEVLFVHKGQGRAILDRRTITVVPGVMVYVPRQAWHGLRNTGTGMLQITWAAAPPGIEEFFREFSRLGAPVDATAMQTLAQRYGIEFRPEGDAGEIRAAMPKHRHRRRGRSSRGGGHMRRPAVPLTRPQAAQPLLTQPSAGAITTPRPLASPTTGGAPSAQPRQQVQRPQPRRRRGPPARSNLAQTSISPPSASPPSGRAPQRDRGRRRHRGRIKEVYMGGRWVQVTGEGPVIDA